MRVDFKYPLDNLRHRYCFNCHQETVTDVDIEGKHYFRCTSCGQTNDRLIDLNPQRVWWIDDKTKDLWHETVGVVVTDEGNRILLIDRTLYPYGLTFPAGHLDANGESVGQAAKRELFEETGINSEVQLISTEDVKDLCRGGADFHRWHLFTCTVPSSTRITVDSHEGKDPAWLDPATAKNKNLTAPTRYFLEKYFIK